MLDYFLQVSAKMSQVLRFIKKLYAYKNLGAFNSPDTCNEAYRSIHLEHFHVGSYGQLAKFYICS